MEIDFCAIRRDATLADGELHMARAGEVLAADTWTVVYGGDDCGEGLFIPIGFVGGRMAYLVWTFRKSVRRRVDMRKTSL